MNGCQFEGTMKKAPAAMTTTTTATLTTTITALTVADSLTPTISSSVTAIVMMTAGRLKTAVTRSLPGTWTSVPGAALMAAGNVMPSWRSNVTKFPDHPTATVASPRAYSRMRSQPMTHAMNSPSVAYAYVYADPATGTDAANSE